MSNPTAAMLVIGDEILSGRTRDSNMHYLAGELTRIGIRLAEVRVVADEHAAIVAAVNALRAAYDNVFTSGGIGPTHDDITADAIAAAFGAPITHRADAMALLGAHYERQGLPFHEARQRMARIPDGAVLIENPISTAPGFTLGNVHVMAGVPSIFQAMVASVGPVMADVDDRNLQVIPDAFQHSHDFLAPRAVERAGVIVPDLAEMVAADVKPIALSEPLTSHEAENLWTDAQEIAKGYGVEVFRESDLIKTMLFPESVAEGKEVMIFHKPSFSGRSCSQ